MTELHLPDERDDYLWRADGPEDPAIAALERALAPLRLDPARRPRLDLPATPVMETLRPRLRAAAALLLAAVAAIWLAPGRGGPDGWAVEGLAGAVRVGARSAEEPGRLAVRQWLETGDDAEARLRVGTLGRVTVGPRSRVRLLAAERDGEQRLELARGRVDAFIVAPPRLFFVETPAATAVDYGCAYTLVVDEAGDGWLEVTAGWVALETDGRQVMVPRGARCRMDRRLGPGTPLAIDAPVAVREAIGTIDLAAGPAREALDRLLARARDVDLITLWHVLPRLERDDRVALVERLRDEVPMPEGVTAAGVVDLDATMLERWRAALMPAAWRRLSGVGG